MIKDIKLKNCAKNLFEKCKDPPVIFKDLDFSFPFAFSLFAMSFVCFCFYLFVFTL